MSGINPAHCQAQFIGLVCKFFETFRPDSEGIHYSDPFGVEQLHRQANLISLSVNFIHRVRDVFHSGIERQLLQNLGIQAKFNQCIFCLTSSRCGLRDPTSEPLHRHVHRASRDTGDLGSMSQTCQGVSGGSDFVCRFCQTVNVGH